MTKPIGRPSSYTPAIADAICDRLAGGESLRAICTDAGIPSDRSVYRWLEENAEFRHQYARAREAQADRLVEEMLEIVDTPPGSTDMGATDTGMVADKRLRFDARRWLASKMAPKKYGDKIDIDLKADIAVSEMTEDDIKAELATLVAMSVAVPQKESDDDSSDLV